MNTKTESAIKFPKIVDSTEWKKARDAFLVKEKAATHALDALAAERRRLPMMKIEKDYIFNGPDGKVSLLDLFEVVASFFFITSCSRRLSVAGRMPGVSGARW